MSVVEFSRLVDLSDLASGEKVFRLEATPDECLKLAKRFDLEKLFFLKANLRGSYRAGICLIQGDIEAKMARQCVVSSNVFESEHQSSFELKLVRDDLFDEENYDVELLEGDVLDLGEIVAQHFYLELDPYPKDPQVNVL